MKRLGAGVAILGVGRMGEAFLAGLLRSGYDPVSIIVHDVDGCKMKTAVSVHGVRAADTPDAAVWAAETVILTVKPKDVLGSLSGLGSRLSGKTLVSFAAGVKVAYLARIVPSDTLVVRAMPNLACKVGKGVIAVACPHALDLEKYRRALDLIGKTGEVYEVDENMLDAVTGLTGSGPAYVCYFLEALTEVAARMGIQRGMAESMTRELLDGTLSLMSQEQMLPEDLRQMVTTPGGTTAKGIEALERCGFKGCVATAVEAAAKRACEISSEVG